MDIALALRSFVRVAETGSFSAVARQDGDNQPTVSRHITFLERHYGVRLFSRTTRHLSITPEGTELLRHARTILETLETADATLGRRAVAPTGLVRVATPTAFGLFAAARLPEFLAGHPGLRVELIMRDAVVDMVEEGVDLAIRVDTLAEAGLVVRMLGRVERRLVASPAYLARQAAPASAADLVAHDCIAYSYGTGRYVWRFLRDDGAPLEIPASGPIRANNSEAVHQAVLGGGGLGLLPDYQVRADVLAGRLVVLLPEWRTEPLGLQLVYPGPRNLPLRSRAVFDFLVSVGREAARSS